MKHFLSLLLVLTLAPHLHAVEIPHANPRFRFTLPPGFQGEAIPRMKETDFRPLLSYSCAYKEDRLSLYFAAMGQEIPEPQDGAEERLKQLGTTLIPWKQHRVGFRWQENNDGTILATALLPLEREALCVGVLGKREHREEIERILLQVVATIDGPASWKTNAERASEFYTIALKFGVVAALVGFLLYMTIGERRKAPAAIHKRRKPLTPPPATSGTPSASTASSAETPGRNDSGT